MCNEKPRKAWYSSQVRLQPEANGLGLGEPVGNLLAHELQIGVFPEDRGHLAIAIARERPRAFDAWPEPEIAVSIGEGECAFPPSSRPKLRRRKLIRTGCW